MFIKIVSRISEMRNLIKVYPCESVFYDTIKTASNLDDLKDGQGLSPIGLSLDTESLPIEKTINWPQNEEEFNEKVELLDYVNKELPWTRFAIYKSGEDKIFWIAASDVYLMSDEGQTIDKVKIT